MPGTDQQMHRTSNDRNTPTDPTALTREALLREIAGLKDWVEGQFEVRDERLRGIDSATSLRLEQMRNQPEQIREQIEHLELLHNEKFNSIKTQFTERDIRSEQASKASTEALAAALQAAKELVGAQGEASAAAAVKSETSFTKQIDQIGTIISTLEKSLDARITELKERIDRGEGQQAGKVDSQVDSRSVQQLAHSAAQLAAARLYGVIGAVVGVGGLAAVVVIAIIR